MTSEERQKLSDLTIEAVELNDIDSIKNIEAILLEDQRSSELKEPMGLEWFYNLVPNYMLEPGK